MVLAEPNTLRPTQIIDVRIDVLSHASRGIKSRSRVRLHVGAAEVLGRVRVLEQPPEISPGDSAFAQLRLEAPIIVVHGDRFIIRSYSPAETIAGGVVLDPFASKHRGKEIAKTLSQLDQLMSAKQVEKMAGFVKASSLRGLKVDDLVAATGWKLEVVRRIGSQAENAETVVQTSGVLLSPESFDRLSRNVLSELENHHKREPLARGMLRETLREKVFVHSPPELFGGVIGKLEKTGQLVSEKDIVRASSHKVDLSEKDSDLWEKLQQIYIAAGVEAPSIDDAMARAGVGVAMRGQARKVLQLLIDDGTIVRVQNEMFMHKTVLADLKTKLLFYAAQHEPERLIDVATFKDLAGVSRKYAIPLLEYFDRERVTRRAGDKRLIL
jgi:selenocysteine-specific elongation factor